MRPGPCLRLADPASALTHSEGSDARLSHVAAPADPAATQSPTGRTDASSNLSFFMRFLLIRSHGAKSQCRGLFEAHHE